MEVTMTTTTFSLAEQAARNPENPQYDVASILGGLDGDGIIGLKGAFARDWVVRMREDIEVCSGRLSPVPAERSVAVLSATIYKIVELGFLLRGIARVPQSPPDLPGRRRVRADCSGAHDRRTGPGSDINAA